MAERHDGIMSEARFRHLSEAYGGRIERWPETDRAAADCFAATDEGKRLLANATRLDQMLDRFEVAQPSPALERRIIAEARRPRGILALIRSRWAGLGLVGVGLAGAATGAAAMMLVLTAPVHDTGLGGDRIATVFGDISESRSDLGEGMK
jgi:anti-sigma factor RsiW